MLLTTLLRSAMQGEGDGPPFSYARAGDLFGVSRTHVRTIFVDAERKGFVRLSSQGGQDVEIAPRLWEKYDQFVADVMVDHDRLARLATAALASERDAAA
jgi:hypothetical protein